MAKWTGKYNSLVKTIKELCEYKNVTCIITNTTHWILFEFIKSDGSSIKHEINRMSFINVESNDLIVNRILQKIDELIFNK